MNRKYIYYELETLEPLIISNSSETGNLVRTNDYIPGNTMLGLFASLYLKKKKKSYSNHTVYNDDFSDMFLSDTVHFYNAYPLHADRIKTIPMPMTVFGCKHFGENLFNSREKQHGFYDMVYNTVPNNYVCNVNGCKCEMKHKDGYLYYYEGVPKNLNVRKRIDAHINVEEEQLYAFEAIEKSTLFYGYIGIYEDFFNPYSELLRELAEVNLALSSDYPFRIGKARNRGHGLIRLNYLNEEEYPFNRKLSMKTVNGTNLFSIYCYSDVILQNSTGQYYTWIDPIFIHNNLELNKELSYWQTATYRGFNKKKKMPTRKEVIIKKGSVFVFTAENNHFNLTDLPESIGELQNEGFGKLIYNHKSDGKVWL